MVRKGRRVPARWAARGASGLSLFRPRRRLALGSLGSAGAVGFERGLLSTFSPLAPRAALRAAVTRRPFRTTGRRFARELAVEAMNVIDIQPAGPDDPPRGLSSAGEIRVNLSMHTRAEACRVEATRSCGATIEALYRHMRHERQPKRASRSATHSAGTVGARSLPFMNNVAAAIRSKYSCNRPATARPSASSSARTAAS